MRRFVAGLALAGLLIACGQPQNIEAPQEATSESAAYGGMADMDRAVIRMADDLRYDAMISDATWAELRKGYSDNQVMELLFTSAQYQLVSMALNTLGVQLEDGYERMPQ